VTTQLPSGSRPYSDRKYLPGSPTEFPISLDRMPVSRRASLLLIMLEVTLMTVLMAMPRSGGARLHDAGDLL